MIDLPASSGVRELRVEYRKQAGLRYAITPVLYHIADNCLLLSMNGEDGKPHAVVEITL